MQAAGRPRGSCARLGVEYDPPGYASFSGITSRNIFRREAAATRELGFAEAVPYILPGLMSHSKRTGRLPLRVAIRSNWPIQVLVDARSPYRSWKGRRNVGRRSRTSGSLSNGLCGSA